jgi:hypothetical protein
MLSPLRRNWLCKDSENGGVSLSADVVARLEDYRGPMLTAEVVGSVAGILKLWVQCRVTNLMRMHLNLFFGHIIGESRFQRVLRLF